MLQHAAIDQHGQVYLNLGDRPRSALLARLGATRAKRTAYGWIVAGLQLSVFRLEPFASL